MRKLNAETLLVDEWRMLFSLPESALLLHKSCLRAGQRKVFPELLGSRISTPRREVMFFGTPAGDDGFDSANLPVLPESRFFTCPSIEGRGLKIAINGAS